MCYTNSVNFLIRLAQVFLGLTLLNGAYGLALQLGFSPLSGKRPTLWNIIGSIVTIITLGVIIFLLQRYYEIRNKKASTDARMFMGVALTSTSVAALIGFMVVVAIAGVAIANL